jgi:hypothetical protein
MAVKPSLAFHAGQQREVFRTQIIEGHVSTFGQRQARQVLVQQLIA